MVKFWRRYIFHPLFIGFIISASLVFFIVRSIPHYKIKIIETYTVNNNGQITYSDLDNDGSAEKIHYYHYNNVFDPMLYVYDTENNIQSLWNFFESPIKNCPVYTGDFNNDQIQEIYLFTQDTDSIFLYVLNTKDVKSPYVKKQLVSAISGKMDDVEINIIGLSDLNKDGVKEFIFSMDAGYPTSPVKLFAYNFKMNKLISSVNLDVDLSNHVLITDIDNDRYMELLISNSSVEIQGNGNQTKFIVLDHRLAYKFEPVKYHGLPSKITTGLIKENDSLLFVCLHSGLNDSGIFNSLILFDQNGNKKGEKQLDFKCNLSLIENNEPASLLLLSKQKLIKLNKRLKPIKRITISKNNEVKYLGRYNMGLGKSSEFLFRDKHDLLIYYDDFKKNIKLRNIADGDMNLAIVKSKNQNKLLSLQAGTKWYLIELVKNEASVQLILIQVLVFIVILTIIYFLNSFIRLKRSLKNQKNKHLKHVDYDTPEITKVADNLFDKNEHNEMPELKQYTNHFKEDMYEIVNSYSDIEINCQFYPESSSYAIETGLKQKLKTFIREILSYISNKKPQENLSLQFFNHDDRLNIVIECENKLLDYDCLETELNIGSLRKESLWQIDFAEHSEQRNLLSVSIPLKSKTKAGAIKVILAEDHDVSLFGLMSMFKMYDDIEIMGTAKNGMEVLKLLESKKADVVVTDISMPGMDGIELSGQLKKDYPHIKVIVFTMYMENWFVEQLLNHDVKGFVSKSSKMTDLIHAVHDVNDGLNYYCPQFKAKFGVQSVQTENKNHKLDSLTNYELQIIKQFADDLKKKEIAQKLNLSNEMMDSMLANILLKVNAANESEITQIAKRQKFVSE